MEDQENIFGAEVGCVYTKRDEVEGHGEVVGRVSGVGEEG